MHTYDMLVIGGGPGGYVAAIKGAQLGLSVMLVEKEEVGGICLNHGCIPTKTLLKNVKVYDYVRHASTYGVTVGGDVSFDWAAMLKRKDSVVKRLTGGVGMLLKKNKVTVVKGEADIVSKDTVKVANETYKAKNIVIATGASPVVPPIKGLKEMFEKGFVKTSREMLTIENAPKKLVIIGGGVIGVEFASIFSTLGSDVTVIERLDGILPMMDDDIRDAYLKVMKKNGTKVFAKAEVTEVAQGKVTYKTAEGTTTVEADSVLLSVGMRANLKGTEALKLDLDKGAIMTDETLQTSVKGVYAIGDVNGKYMLAHVASAEGIIVAERIAGHDVRMDYTMVPSAVYGAPEIASIGLTESEAKASGRDYQVSVFPLAGNGRALAENEKDGFAKLIIDSKYKEIIGAHIMASNASDLISEIGVAMKLEGTAYEVASTIHAHPTISEIIMEAAHGAVDKPIHM
jgi:dihydrolipoamide dehydrogenase